MSENTAFSEQERRYLSLLAKKYPTIESAGGEIINLQAILNLPKGTEHFVSDIHGEYDPFSHVLRNASGVIKDLIERTFGDSVPENEKKSLAALIYYPEKKLAIAEKTENDLRAWYRTVLYRLVLMCRAAASKYTRSKVRKALPASYAYIIEELLHEDEQSRDKQRYYDQIIETIIAIDQASDFIVAMGHLIQRLAIDRLHVIGDIYDRGRKAVKIMDVLSSYHSVDVQWGNHDVSWMGAAGGCQALICNVLRIQARYGNLDTVEEDYGINLVPLATFAMETYRNDPCTAFLPSTDRKDLTAPERELMAKIHKAVAVMQFKCEAQIIARRPEFGMDDRALVTKIDQARGTVKIDGRDYPLNDTFFPTVDPAHPADLSAKEAEILDRLTTLFTKNEKLQKHVRFLFTAGGIYKIYNGNLLYHGGVPMNRDGSLKTVAFRGEHLKGRVYLDAIDRTLREGYFSKKGDSKELCLDWTWYVWCGMDSPVYGKQKMTTFERYFVEDPAVYEEIRNPYYELRDDEAVCKRILADFGLTGEESHIINGHVPVRVNKGEKPVKGGGKLFVIDGGFSKAYQPVTGIAGYTLIYNSHGLVLVSHEPFVSADEAVREEKDILSYTVEYQHSRSRIRVSDTDTGAEIRADIADLTRLLSAYRQGILKERTN